MSAADTYEAEQGLALTAIGIDTSDLLMAILQEIEILADVAKNHAQMLEASNMLPVLSLIQARATVAVGILEVRSEAADAEARDSEVRATVSQTAKAGGT